MADALNDEQRTLINENFLIVSDNGPTIPKDKLIKLVQLLGQNPSNKQIEMALKACELDEEVELTQGDCEAVIWSVWYEMKVDDELREAFAKFDTNNNGKLEATEFKKAMKSYGEGFTDDELEEMMKLVDVNEDGFIDYEEFVSAMTKEAEIEANLEEEEEAEEAY